MAAGREVPAADNKSLTSRATELRRTSVAQRESAERIAKQYNHEHGSIFHEDEDRRAIDGFLSRQKVIAALQKLGLDANALREKVKGPTFQGLDSLCNQLWYAFLSPGYQRTLADEVMWNYWYFSGFIILSTLPSLISAIYALILSGWSPSVSLSDCTASPLGVLSSHLNESSFTMSCAGGALPNLNFVQDDGGLLPDGADYKGPSGTCEAINTIMQDPLQLAFGLLVQAGINILFAMWALRSVQVEAKEKEYVLAAFHLHGVYDNARDVADKSVRFLKDWCTFPNLSGLIYFLAILYNPQPITIAYISPNEETLATMRSWASVRASPRFETHYTQYVNYVPYVCEAVVTPLKLTYEGAQRISWPTAALQALLFFGGVWQIKSTQAKVYDFIDVDKLMEPRNEDCPYKEIHQHRWRVYTLAMLKDWLFVNIDVPALERLLDSPALATIDETKLPPAETPDELKPAGIAQLRAHITSVRERWRRAASDHPDLSKESSFFDPYDAATTTEALMGSGVASGGEEQQSPAANAEGAGHMIVSAKGFAGIV